MSFGTAALGSAPLGTEAGATSIDAAASGGTLTGTSTLIPGSAIGTGSGAASGATLTGTSTLTPGSANSPSATGTITIPTLASWPGGALRQSETGISILILNSAGALVLALSGQATDANADIPAIVSSAIVTGIEYIVITRHSDNSLGCWPLTAT